MSGRPIKRTFRGPERTLQRDGPEHREGEPANPGQEQRLGRAHPPVGPWRRDGAGQRDDGVQHRLPGSARRMGARSMAGSRSAAQGLRPRWRMRRSRKARTRPSRPQ